MTVARWQKTLQVNWRGPRVGPGDELHVEGREVRPLCGVDGALGEKAMQRFSTPRALRWQLQRPVPLLQAGRCL
eukprot:807303-Lingulodinium_polyedra.AAC.1